MSWPTNLAIAEYRAISEAPNPQSLCYRIEQKVADLRTAVTTCRGHDETYGGYFTSDVDHVTNDPDGVRKATELTEAALASLELAVGTLSHGGGVTIFGLSNAHAKALLESAARTLDAAASRL